MTLVFLELILDVEPTKIYAVLTIGRHHVEFQASLSRPLQHSSSPGLQKFEAQVHFMRNKGLDP
jgi:hypothetical protein